MHDDAPDMLYVPARQLVHSEVYATPEMTRYTTASQLNSTHETTVKLKMHGTA